MRISDWSSDVCSSDLFVYAYTQIDGTGSYRLSGTRGDALFLLFDFAAGGLGALEELGPSEIGRASCREGVCPYVLIWVVGGSLKKQTVPYRQSISDRHKITLHMNS